MKALLLLVLLLLPATAHAQLDYRDCLQEGRVDNRISGKVMYVEWKHPFNGDLIKGYKIILVRPRCFNYEPRINLQTMADIDEVQLLIYGHTTSYKMQDRFFKTTDATKKWTELNQRLQPLIGKYVIVTGQMEDNVTAYYVTNPQIVVRSITSCETEPRSKAIEKC